MAVIGTNTAARVRFMYAGTGLNPLNIGGINPGVTASQLTQFAAALQQVQAAPAIDAILTRETDLVSA